mmetsp:Transcript_32569/g.95319  ORF Transcript_32569/g.95319 Transcript_32569/m.95319 type:complete len:301 (-) Transcript_32569:1111-2013(-)
MSHDLLDAVGHRVAGHRRLRPGRPPADPRHVERRPLRPLAGHHLGGRHGVGAESRRPRERDRHGGGVLVGVGRPGRGGRGRHVVVGGRARRAHHRRHECLSVSGLARGGPEHPQRFRALGDPGGSAGVPGTARDRPPQHAEGHEAPQVADPLAVPQPLLGRHRGEDRGGRGEVGAALCAASVDARLLRERLQAEGVHSAVHASAGRDGVHRGHALASSDGFGGPIHPHRRVRPWRAPAGRQPAAPRAPGFAGRRGRRERESLEAWGGGRRQGRGPAGGLDIVARRCAEQDPRVAGEHHGL